MGLDDSDLRRGGPGGVSAAEDPFGGTPGVRDNCAVLLGAVLPDRLGIEQRDHLAVGHREGQPGDDLRGAQGRDHFVGVCGELPVVGEWGGGWSGLSVGVEGSPQVLVSAGRQGGQQPMGQWGRAGRSYYESGRIHLENAGS